MIVVVSMSTVMLMLMLVIMIGAPTVPSALVVRLVFRGSYEVHRPIAGIILSAMPAPILRMSRRHV
jgi:hypothetical protein